ncbi:MAG: pseudouridine-5'-phosphate glycosidase [Microthrixaceae bacterium]
MPTADASLRLSPEVADALGAGMPVVALESTIFSRLGLPAPHNAEALRRCLAAVRVNGAVPALTAVLDGAARVGIEPVDHPRLLEATAKVSSRDLPVAVGAGWPVGVTTVAASLRLARLAGVGVFATGGIGGVHRGAGTTHDVSADLGALATEPVVCVTAGAKAFLDLGATLERLDTLGVPVLGWGTDTFPAFYSRDSGHAVAHRVDDLAELARIVAAGRALGHRGGVLVANPIPGHAEIPAGDIQPHIEEALAAAERDGVTGAAVTPWVLEAIGQATAGRSIPANLALAEHNATLAAKLAVALAG